MLLFGGQVSEREGLNPTLTEVFLRTRGRTTEAGLRKDMANLSSDAQKVWQAMTDGKQTRPKE